MKPILGYLALHHNIARNAWVKFCRPSPEMFATYLKRFGTLHAIGDHCAVSPHAQITDPAYTRLGNNVRLANCLILGHDGSINMLERAYGRKLDRVGKVDLRDNVFVGQQAILMPGVTIGPNAIVAAGSVVTKDVPPGVIVAGVPAKVIGQVDALVVRLEQQLEELPWGDLIRQRIGGYDARMEVELVRRRVAYFYGASDSDEPDASESPTSPADQSLSVPAD